MSEGIKVAAGIVAFFGIVVLSGAIERLHARWRWAKRARQRRRQAASAPIVIELGSPRLELQPMPPDSIMLGKFGLRGWFRVDGELVQFTMTSNSRRAIGRVMEHFRLDALAVSDEMGDPAPGTLKVIK